MSELDVMLAVARAPMAEHRSKRRAVRALARSSNARSLALLERLMLGRAGHAGEEYEA